MFKLFHNEPKEYRELFKLEMLFSNYRTVYYMLRIIPLFAVFMLGLSLIVRDSKNVIIANAVLSAMSLVLFVISIRFSYEKKEQHKQVKMWIVYLTYGVILFWGLHMVGYNSHESIPIMDMVIAIFITAFLFMNTYQILAGYYIGGLAYLFLLTPYANGGFAYLPILVSPVLLMLCAFFMSRMSFVQFIDRFVMSEKLKVKQESLSSELVTTLEKLRITEHNINTDIIRTLVKVLEYYDIYTRGHSGNVAEYAVRTGEALGFATEQMDEIMICGLVHDIGKILIPLDLLNKTTKLTFEEFEVIKKHSQYGYDMLNEAKNLKHIAKIVLHHHERWDGKGYPFGLKANEIPVGSQILMVADAWDAMTSDRIYKKAKSYEVAKAEMLALRGKQFSPSVVDALFRAL